MTAKTPKGLSHCSQLVRDHDHDRWLTMLFANADDREALAALYAFNHEVAKTRETVSEPILGEIRLEWWREAIEGLYQGTVRRHPVTEALASAMEARTLPQTEFEAIIDGRLSDLYDTNPKSFDDLLDYADKTGGTVSRLAARICGVEDDPLLDAASAIGRAWALTGLLRALGFQAAMRRTMLPDESLDKAGISKETLFKGEFSPELIPVINNLVETARAALDEGRKVPHLITAQQRSPFLLAVTARSYLKRLEQSGGDPFATDFSRGATRRQLKLLWSALRNTF